MPSFPDVSRSLAAIGGAVYSGLAARIANFEGERFPLHVGDTWLEPAEGCRMQDLRVEDHPGMHRYSEPQGLAALIDRLVEVQRERTGLTVERTDVLITAGATGGLGAACGAICEPGDEVLILAPYWPLIAGIVRCFGGVPVAVPMMGESIDDDEAIARLERSAGDRTIAVYLSTPNNPTGQVLPAARIEAIARWATRRGFWLLTDEVYEDYAYEGTHTYARPFAPGRTLAAHSFSKAYGMAGNRIGYVVGPAETMRALRKVSTHSFYNAPTAGQLAALHALDGPGQAWVDRVRPQYAAAGRAAAERLGVPAPQGGQFLFLDVADHLDDDGLAGFLGRCADRGLLLAPGPSFGPFPTRVRLCFTCCAPEVTARGVDVLADLLGR